MLRSIADRVRSVFAWWMNDIRRRPSTIGKAASLLIGLLVLCCACSFGMAVLRGTGQAVGLVAADTPTPSPPPTPTPEPEPTLPPTEPPTDTPLPTDTPAPTDTPLPTNTPEPAPTAAPAANGLTTEEKAAVATIGQQLAEIAGALKDLGTLAQNAENTNQWKLAMALQMGRIRAAHETILNMDAPPKIGALRAATLNATSDCNEATVKLASGLDNNRPADIVEATKLMQSCGAKIGDVMPELQKLQP